MGLRIFLAFYAVLTLGGAELAASPPREPLLWRRDTVDADINGLDLRVLLGLIASHTGWQVYAEPGLHTSVSAKFHELPLSQALKALLGGLNFALLPQTNGSPKLFVFESNLQEATEAIRPVEKTARPPGKAIPNELVVTLKDKSKETIDALAAGIGAKVMGRAGERSTYRLQFADEAEAQSAREALKGNSQVLGVEDNFGVDHPTRTDPLSLTSVNPTAPKTKNAGGDKGIIIGLIDTGVQRQGTPLNDLLLPALSVVGESKLPSDYPTHGTSMSETVAQGFGLSSSGGEALPVRILPVDIYGANPSTTTFEVAAGIEAAIRNGATIINLSLGSDGNSPLLQKVIQSAHKDGIIFLAAAGNEPTTGPVYPAAYPEVVAVTAGDRKGEIASYANRGAFVDVAAPGTSIVYYNDQAYLVSGTSAATAYVSGLTAGVAASSKKALPDVEKQVRQMLAVKTKP